MRVVITSIICAGITAAGLFAALSPASRSAQPVRPVPGRTTVVYPTFRPEAPAYLVARYKYNKRGDSRRIRCAGLVDACFYNSPMGETGRR